MVRVNLTIPDKGARLSVPPGWSHRSDDKGYLLVTPDYIPGCRMSFSFRSMPEGMPALAFIHHNAQKREADVCKSGENWYIFYEEKGGVCGGRREGILLGDWFRQPCGGRLRRSPQ
jgi:hypothetical protein